MSINHNQVLIFMLGWAHPFSCPSLCYTFLSSSLPMFFFIFHSSIISSILYVFLFFSPLGSYNLAVQLCRVKVMKSSQTILYKPTARSRNLINADKQLLSTEAYCMEGNGPYLKYCAFQYSVTDITSPILVLGTQFQHTNHRCQTCSLKEDLLFEYIGGFYIVVVRNLFSQDSISASLFTSIACSRTHIQGLRHLIEVHHECCMF